MSLEYDASAEDAEDCPVTFTHRDGKTDEYFIRSFDCAARNQYLTNVTKRLHTDSNGQQFIQDYVNLEAVLLTKCLHHKATGKLVTEKEVNAFPPKFADKVFREAKKVCGLDAEAEDAAKNS